MLCVAGLEYVEYSFAREKSREWNRSQRLIRLRINKRAKTSLRRASRRYEKCMLVCADLLKNISRTQLLRLPLFRDSRLSLFLSRFPFFFNFLYFSRSV